MPRDGSNKVPSTGPVPAQPMDIGEIANPPLAVLPDPSAVFRRRAERFRALADAGADLGPYLSFLAAVSDGQHAALEDLPEAVLPDATALELAHKHAMPPLGRAEIETDAAALAAFDALLARLAEAELPDASRAAIAAIAAATPEARSKLLEAALNEDPGEADVAAHVLASAALQIHFARLAAKLDVDTLQKITDGACPACGGAPVASAVVNWEGSSNSRFCTCSLCATQWHVVRVHCLCCGSEKDITFNTVAGGNDDVKAETCSSCNSYVKIVYQIKDGALDPTADDVASLSLDLLLADKGYLRFSQNPFLIGY